MLPVARSTLSCLLPLLLGCSREDAVIAKPSDCMSDAQNLSSEISLLVVEHKLAAQTKDWHAAIEALESLEGYGCFDNHTIRQKSEYLIEVGKIQVGVQELQRLVNLENSPAVYIEVGDVWRTQEQHGLAIEQYERFLESIGSPTDYLSQQTAELQAMIGSSDPRGTPGYSYLRKALRGLGAAALASKDLTKAENSFLLLREIMPEQPDGYVGLAQLSLAKNSNLEDGLRNIDQAKTLSFRVSPEIEQTRQAILDEMNKELMRTGVD